MFFNKWLKFISFKWNLSGKGLMLCNVFLSLQPLNGSEEASD